MNSTTNTTEKCSLSSIFQVFTKVVIWNLRLHKKRKEKKQKKVDANKFELGTQTSALNVQSARHDSKLSFRKRNKKLASLFQSRHRENIN